MLNPSGGVLGVAYLIIGFLRKKRETCHKMRGLMAMGGTDSISETRKVRVHTGVAYRDFVYIRDGVRRVPLHPLLNVCCMRACICGWRLHVTDLAFCSTERARMLAMGWMPFFGTSSFLEKIPSDPPS